MNDIAALKARVDIAEIIGARVELYNRMGRLWGPCPFHEEKTSSFSVNTERQRFHCFGCKADGDVFDFISRFEGVKLRDAIKILGGDMDSSIKRTRRKILPWIEVQEEKDISHEIEADKWAVVYDVNDDSGQWVKVLGAYRISEGKYLLNTPEGIIEPVKIMRKGRRVGFCVASLK